eukprot:5738328-Prymnesium_polylepis.1
MILDELRQLGLVARRRSESFWVDCQHEGGGTTRGEYVSFCAAMAAHIDSHASRRSRDPVKIAYLACEGS